MSSRTVLKSILATLCYTNLAYASFVPGTANLALFDANQAAYDPYGTGLVEPDIAAPLVNRQTPTCSLSGSSVLCPGNTTCCPSTYPTCCGNGTNACCPPQTVCQNNGTSCCPSNATVCAPNTCYQVGSTCCGTSACPAGAQCKTTPDKTATVCCQPSQIACNGAYCCPSGTTCYKNNLCQTH